jgi:glycerophosphoryl diester phosphodiesterase
MQRRDRHEAGLQEPREHEVTDTPTERDAESMWARLRISADLHRCWRQSLVFHLLMQLFGLAMFGPLLTWAGHRLVLASGEPVISNFDIAVFVLSPIGVVFVLIVAALTTGLVLAELAGQSWIAGHAIDRRSTSVTSTIAVVLRQLPALILLGGRMFLRLAVLCLPFLAGCAVIWLTTLRGHDINYYLTERPPEWVRALRLAGMLGATYAALAAWQLARWVYAVPILVFEGGAPASALQESVRRTRKNLRRIVPPLLLWWLMLTAAAVAIAWAGRAVADAGLDWAGIDFRRVLPLVALYLVVTLAAGYLYSGLQFAGHQILVMRLYTEELNRAKWQVPATREQSEQRAGAVARAAILVMLALLVVAVGTTWVIATRLDLDAEVAITAHRGASVAAPENTMAAFRAAMEAGATYAELDVQRTRDGEIAVLHDGDLMRMGGDPRKLGALTATELATIDIGRKYGSAFAGERAPMLEQVIELVRGRMKLNVELKYNVRDPQLARAVIDRLGREAFIDQVVITSLDYSALKQVKALEPRLKTGHIVTVSVGNVVQSEADFLSLNAARATASMIRRAHAAGKEVHVWTVNQPDAMLRMIERGADNIITDDPALLVRIIEQRQALTRTELLGLRLRVLFDKAPRELTDPAAVEPL